MQKLTFKNVFLSVGITIFSLALFGFVSVGKAQAAETCTAIASTAWDTTSTWSCTGASTVPLAADAVIIPSGFTVTVGGADVAASVTINNVAATTGITISGANSLAVSGAVALNAPSGAGTTTVAIGTGSLTAGSLAIVGGGTGISQVTLSTGSLTISGVGNAVLSGTVANARITGSGAGAITVGGNLTNGGTINTGADGLAVTGNVSISNGASLVTGSGTLAVTGTSTINTGGTLTVVGTYTTGGALSVSGALNLTNGSFTASNTTEILSGGVVTLSGTSGSKTFTRTLTVDLGGVYNETAANGTGITFSGAVSSISIANAGTATLNTGSHIISHVINNTGTFNYAEGVTLTTLSASTSGLVNYNGDAQTVQLIGYYNLGLSGTGSKVFTNTVVVGNDLTIDGTATVALTGVSTANRLIIGGTIMRPGSWGAAGYGTYNDATLTGGTGTITVATGRKVVYQGDINPNPTTTTTTSTGTSTTTTTTTTTPAPTLIITAVPSTTTVTTTTLVNGCTGLTGFSVTTGQTCSTGSIATTTATPIAGCDSRTTGFSTVSGVSCVGNGVPTTITYNFGTVTLKNGSKGSAVMDLQRFLNKFLNLGLVVDGKLGPKTIAVIKKWQTDNGLVADGLVGAKTKAKMQTEAETN